MFTLASFYRSREWEKIRHIAIENATDEDSGLVICAMCGKPILKGYDLVVDHIQELTEDNVNDYSISLNPNNLQCLHFACHNRKHARFGFGSGGYVQKPKKVYLVWGSPCAGKSTWVHEVATQDDLIVDMDSIWECITVGNRYEKPVRLKGAAFAVRDALYDLIKYRSGKWQNAYVIAGVPSAGDRERLKARIGADELVFIQASKEECLTRASDRPDEWVQYVNDWFAAFQPE